jgi:GntR family transcriptional repressor for pyruvate dehydrogenase complex
VGRVPAKDVPLEALGPVALREQVLDRLRRLIDDGTLAPGDRLPGERALADALGVSRGTVREAVQFLQALGVVKIRHGAGTFVRPLDGSDGLREEWRRWTIRHGDTVRNLLEVRMGLESFAAELAASRARTEDLSRMAEVLRQMEEAARNGDVTALVRSDVLFHRALCEAAGNPALAHLAEELGRRLVRERAAVWGRPGRPARSLAQHRAIYEAVRGRHRERARRAVLAHLSSIRDEVEALRSAASDPGTVGRQRTGGR